jgi:hypothetical protein
LELALSVLAEPNSQHPFFNPVHQAFKRSQTNNCPLTTPPLSTNLGTKQCLARTAEKRVGDAERYLRALGLTRTDADPKAPKSLESIQDVLEAQSDLEQLMESRCLSLERLLAFLVTFHTMGTAVASLPPLRFETDRSQSALRICTTAGPISASALVAEFEETRDFYERSATFDHGKSASMRCKAE